MLAEVIELVKPLSQEQYEIKPLIPEADLILIKQTSKLSMPEKVTVKVPDLFHFLPPLQQNNFEEKKQVQIITVQPQPVAVAEDDYELPFPFCEKKH